MHVTLLFSDRKNIFDAQIHRNFYELNNPYYDN